MTMKVFVSSVIAGYEEFRIAATTAAESLGTKVIKAEEFEARGDTPRVACLRAVREADIVIMLLGSRYGAIQQSGISATHEEFREAKMSSEILAFVESAVEQEPNQKIFISEVQDWVSGVYTNNFANVEELRNVITRSLHNKLMEASSIRADADELLAKCKNAIDGSANCGDSNELTLAVAVSSALVQPILRPSQLDSAHLEDLIYYEALDRRHHIFDRGERTSKEIIASTLILKQETRRISLSSDGTVLLLIPINFSSHRMLIIEENLLDILTRCLFCISSILDRIDEMENISQLCIAIQILNADHVGWKTQSEYASDPNRYQIKSFHNGDEIVSLNPPIRSRSEFKRKARDLAEDFTAILRGKFI